MIINIGFEHCLVGTIITGRMENHNYVRENMFFVHRIEGFLSVAPSSNSRNIDID